MALSRAALQHKQTRAESPAKVFARMKSSVQREAAAAAREGGGGGGGFTANDSLLGRLEGRGADSNAPWRTTDNRWMADEPKEEEMFGWEAEALTLSPISSPQKSLGSSYWSPSRNAGARTPRVTGGSDALTPGGGYRAAARPFMESTAVFHPHVDTRHLHADPATTSDPGGFSVIGGTPRKKQPGDATCVAEERRAPPETQVPLDPVFSPVARRLRQRKLELGRVSSSSSSAKEVLREAASLPRHRRTSSAFHEDDEYKINGQGPGSVRGHQHNMSRLSREPECAQPQSTTEARECNMSLDQLQLMTPAKMFAYMKKRESRREQQEVSKVTSVTRDLLDEGACCQARDPSPPALYTSDTMGDNDLRSVQESVSPVTQSGPELVDSQSDTEPPEHVPPSSAPPVPVLFEDPLILNSPQISIPKKHKAVFKHNQWPHGAKFPSESMIYLKKWFLRRNHKGLFVDGRRREDNVPWNSNIVVERVSNSVLKTVSGRVYILVGKMNMDVEPEFPRWLLKKFAKGFPPNWKELYEKFLSESKARGTEKSVGARSVGAKASSETPELKPTVQRHRCSSLKIADSSPPSVSSSTKMSRSGRVIKPPLEYWKGGRVILDADMNVTIFECYDTYIGTPQKITTTVSVGASQKPGRVLAPCSEGKGRRRRSETASDNEPSAPLRRVKASARKHHRAKASPPEKPSDPPEPPVETLSHHISSPEQWSGSKRRPDTGGRPHVGTQSQKKPKKPSTRASKENKPDNIRPPLRVSGRKRTVAPPADSPTDNGQVSNCQSSDEEISVKRKKRGKKCPGKQSERASRLTQSSEESGRELGGRNGRAAGTRIKVKRSQSAKISKPSRSSRRSPQSGRIQKGSGKGNAAIPQDEDEWTEAELIKLQQAVSSYPKHIAGYWAKVAFVVGTRSAEECHSKHTSCGNSRTPAKMAVKTKQKTGPKQTGNAGVQGHPVISARVGTLRRKQQVREFLEAMPREDVDDVFSSAFMQNKRYEIPSMCQSEDHNFTLTNMEPTTPMSTGFPEVKTPQCLHITPGMMGSPSRNHDDKYVFQLQKRMKKKQFNVYKQAPASKTLSPTPSVKRTMRRCGNTENDTFVVWEMFPEKAAVLSESGEEEDFYFSDNDGD